MIARNPYSNCIDARVYYYDFLREETRGGIPENALEHLTQCDDCQLEIERLKDVFERVDKKIDSAQSRKSAAIGTLLKLHFAYIGEPVTCETVKPFLPPLADPALQICTPTPITAHIDRCQKCRDDLQTLRDLQLNHKQLCRLGRLLAGEPTGTAVSCSQAQAAIPSVVSMAFGDTDAEILKHLCTCPECRKQLCQHRETVRKKLLQQDESPRNGLPCEAVSASDIYDYCLPYGLDPASDEYAGFRESLTAHLRSCPMCMAKIQDLHNTICGIAGRPVSEVATIYHIAEKPAEEKSLGESDDGPYVGFPIKVELVDCRDKADLEQPAATVDFTARLKQKASALAARPLFRAGAVAAVLLIGLGLLLSAPTATAITLDRLYSAVLQKTRNVHITSLSGRAEVVEEKWVSRPMNIYMLKTQQVFVLSDVANKVGKVKQSGSGSTEETVLTDEFCAELKQRINGSLGLLPFDRLSDIPKGTIWSRAADESLGIADKNSEVYDLAWLEETSGGSPVFRKAQYFVDPETGLPTKVEFYRRYSAESEYVLQSQLIVEYLSDGQFKALVKDASS